MYRMFCPNKSRYAKRKFHDLVLDNEYDYDDNVQGWISELVKYNPVHKFEEEESQGTSLDQELGRAGEIIDRYWHGT